MPACHACSEDLNGSHGGEFAAQTFMMFLCRGEPHTVIRSVVLFLAQDEDDFFFYVNRKATEHRPREGSQFSEGIQDERVRDGFALLNGKGFLKRFAEGVLGMCFCESAHLMSIPERRQIVAHCENGGNTPAQQVLHDWPVQCAALTPVTARNVGMVQLG